MTFNYNNKEYQIVVEKKKSNKNTYIRVKSNLNVLVTTNLFATKFFIKSLIKENYNKICKMIDQAENKKKNNEGFNYLGKKYNINETDKLDIVFCEDEVFLGNIDIDKWYKSKAKIIFKERFDICYNNFYPKVTYPKLRIRKMTSRWGVCNVTTNTITLNLELIKRDIKYLDYVIIHELSHLIHPDHSRDFWNLVEYNMNDYKKYKNDMKEF